MLVHNTIGQFIEATKTNENVNILGVIGSAQLTKHKVATFVLS